MKYILYLANEIVQKLTNLTVLYSIKQNERNNNCHRKIKNKIFYTTLNLLVKFLVN